MKNRFVNIGIVGIIAIFGFTFYNCDSDPGLEPIRSGISGTIQFVGKWPENTDRIIMVAALKFPPTQVTDLVMGEPLPLNVDTLDYTLWAPVHQYGAAGVVWKEKGQPWNVANIIGMYFPTGDQFAPGALEVKDRDDIVDDVDIVVNFAYAKRHVESSMQGTIRFSGEWPANAQAVLVVASPNALFSIKSLLELYFTSPLPVGVDSTSFSLSLPSGIYKTIGTLIIFKDEPISLSNSVKAIYIDPKTNLPGQVRIPTDTSTVSGIDMLVNFGGSSEPILAKAAETKVQVK